MKSDLENVGNGSKTKSNKTRNTEGRAARGRDGVDSSRVGRVVARRRSNGLGGNRSDGRGKDRSAGRNRADSGGGGGVNLGSGARAVGDGDSASLGDGVGLCVFNNGGGLGAVSGVSSDNLRSSDFTRNGDGGDVGVTSGSNTSKSSDGRNSELHY